MNYNPLRLEWDCRRGMLELDNIIMPFYKNHFANLSDKQKADFVALLACSDLQLFEWLFNGNKASEPHLQAMVERIQQANLNAN